MRCPICGGTMVGDGYTTLRHCEFARPEDCVDKEADAAPVYCVEIVPNGGCSTCTGSPDAEYPHDECGSCNRYPHQEAATK